MRLLIISACLVAGVVSQNVGTLTPEQPLPFSISVCSGPGNCQQESGSVVLDSNWRWTHTTSGYTNCYTGNTWDASLCPDPDTCTSNCAIDGVSSSDWTNTYGATVSGNALSLKLVTQGAYSKNIGSRTYLLDSTGSKYRLFKLINQEFTFDVDVSNLECGLNGALYFVEMDADGGASRYPTNKGGAKYGTGYCDAQCPHDIKWIDGKSNSKNWQPSSNDPNSGVGHYGSCCAEMDIWEANKYSQAYTSHPCSVDQQTQCEGTQCGDNASGDRYNGVCDKDGCDFASYRLGDHSFYGPGSSYKLDTTKPLTVVTQFISTDGTENGDLKEIRRLYVQNGQTIQNSKVNVNGVTQYDSITDEMCVSTKGVFGDTDDHSAKGGVRKMGAALKKGMVLVMSLWDDHDAHMLWLDSNYPADADPSKPGIARGPCSTSSGNPVDVESQYPNASVKYSNIKVGAIGSTY